MKRSLLLSALPLLFWAANSFTEDFERFEELVHIIKVKSTESSSDQARGTGFVVNTNGMLVTNYHVISNVFHNGKIDKRQQIFVKIKAQEFLAEVLKVDILIDRVLLSVPYVFKSQAHIRQTRLAKGESIWCLGCLETIFLAINQGTFNEYRAGTVDGVYDTETGAAVRRYRVSRGLGSSTTMSLATWVALLAQGAVVLQKYGAAGPPVRRLQRALNAADAAGLSITGVFEGRTAAAVRAYQGGHGMKRTGVAGSGVWRRLVSGTP
jgi:peptidoglycan hydrolase-like protein with peptidoglycan-binding domain